MEMGELYSLADAIELEVPDVPDFVAYLNDAGVHGGGGGWVGRCRVR